MRSESHAEGHPGTSGSAGSVAETAGVLVRPPFLYLGALLLGALLQLVWRWEIVPDGWRALLGIPLVAVAAVLLVFAIRQFPIAGTSVKPYEPTTAIITRGPYRFSRNPIYLGFTLLQIGIGLWLDNAWMLVLAIPVLVVMVYGVIAREERYLERKFGDDYLRYKRSVRRWL